MKPVADTLTRVERWMESGTAGLNPGSGDESSARRLLRSTNQRANRRSHVINALRGRLQVLNDAIHTRSRARQKRGLINVGGEILHLLFGTATDSSLTALSRRMDTLGSETTNIVHALSEQASLINGTLWNINAHTELLRRLSEAHDNLKKEVTRIKHFAVAELDDLVGALCRIDDLYETTDQVLSEVQQTVDDWAVSLATLANGRLPPEILSPTRLSRLLTEIRDNLPPGWALTPVLRGADVWRAYQEAVVVTAAFAEGLRLFIHLPVYEFSHSFELYEVTGLPVYAQRLQRATTFEGLPRFLAVSQDQQTFLELETRDVEQCKGIDDMICPVRKAINRKNQRKSCAAALFLHQVDRIRTDCTRSPSPWRGSEAIHVENRRWAYSTNYTQLLVYQCQSGVTAQRSTPINGTGFIDVPRGCSAHSDEWIFQASIRREIAAEPNARGNWTIRELPPLMWATRAVVNESSDSDEDQRSQLISEVINRQQKNADAARSLANNVRRVQEIDDRRVQSDANQGSSSAGLWIAIGILMCASGGLVGWMLQGRKSFQAAIAELNEKVRACTAIQSKTSLELLELHQRMGAHEAAAETWDEQRP